MLTTRILSALVLIPLVIIAAILGGPWLATLLALFAALAAIEFYQICGRLGAHPSVVIGVPLTVAIVFAALFPAYQIGPRLFILALMLLMVIRVFRQDFTGFLSDWAATLTGAAYIGGMLSHFVLLRGLERGLAWTALAVLSTWVGDTAAYFVGSAWGRRPFFPRVSPRKTLEGAIAALVGGTLTAIIIGVLFLELTWPIAALLGVLTTVLETLGDLAESLLKRQADVKDSGRLIPGHGGALDRIDSLLFAAVAVYYFAIWFVGAH